MSRALKGNKRQRAAAVTITGRVQGIGFRPLVHALALQHHLTGWVANTTGGAEIFIEGAARNRRAFLQALPEALPPQARIDRLRVRPAAAQGCAQFAIVPSKHTAAATAEIPPDLALCPECRAELASPEDRRFRYPFINCTRCGPRFSIVKTLPYDRSRTTMASFALCPQCAHEYHDPHDRRFHAQPDACPVCGPHLTLRDRAFAITATRDDALNRAIRLLGAGNIVAIKSIGGYHLACDALNPAAIRRLRRRKNRPHKPFAVMMPDLHTVRRFCQVTPDEAALLQSSAAPIVLLRKKRAPVGAVPASLAPGNGCLGIMLPYTPLHQLLFSDPHHRLVALVMTSGNRGDEPICVTEPAARHSLAGIADYFLTHNRPVHNRCDDSIVQVQPAIGPVLIRRSRGYVPAPVQLAGAAAKAPPVIAAGADLKNTFCFTRYGKAFLSPHIGDLASAEAHRFFREAVNRYRDLLAVRPQYIAHDLHPDYHSTGLARALAETIPRSSCIPVQHHHAHLASVAAEHRLTRPFIGFAYDGTGYGPDGTIWGSECLLVNGAACTRLAHFSYFPLPGGDAAVREIARPAIALLAQAGITDLPAAVMAALPVPQIRSMLQRGINAPHCCSAGRLFDAVAVLAGIATTATFEAAAAMELESLAVDITDKKLYTFTVASLPEKPLVLQLDSLIRAIWNDCTDGVPAGIISMRFHRTLAAGIRLIACRARKTTGLTDVALSGGVFQNRLLLQLTATALRRAGFTVYANQQVPANDGGIALGQAWIAAHHLVHRT